ncbi:MAG: hypothetical protein ACI4CE_05270 [Methanomethylophilus alvi]
MLHSTLPEPPDRSAVWLAEFSASASTMVQEDLWSGFSTGTMPSG